MQEQNEIIYSKCRQADKITHLIDNKYDNVIENAVGEIDSLYERRGKQGQSSILSQMTSCGFIFECQFKESRLDSSQPSNRDSNRCSAANPIYSFL